MSSILYRDEFSEGDANAHFTNWNDLPGILERL
jgi:hypothetical protein